MTELKVGEGRITINRKGLNEPFIDGVKEGDAFITVRVKDAPPIDETNEPMPLYADYKLVYDERLDV